MTTYRVFQKEKTEFYVQRRSWWFPFWCTCFVKGLSHQFYTESDAVDYMNMRSRPVINQLGERIAK